MYLIHLLKQLWHKGYFLNQVFAELLEELQKDGVEVTKDGDSQVEINSGILLFLTIIII